MLECRSLAYVCMDEWGRGRGRTNEVSSVEKPLKETKSI